MSKPVVDAWMQPATSRFLKHEMFASVRRWIRMDTVPDHIPPEVTLDAVREGGVTQGLLSAWWTPDGPLISNDEVAELVRRAPDRFVGVGSVDPRRPMAAVRELRRCVKQLGFKALRVLPWVWELPPTDRLFYPLFAECIELGIPFCSQVGHTGPLRPSEVGRPIPYVDQIAIDFPELVFVGGHIGFPWTQEMIAVATKHTNVYIDTSAYKPSRFPPELVAYMKSHGASKVLFGTNFPMVQPREALAEVPSLQLSPQVEEMFLSGNARKVFKLQ